MRTEFKNSIHMNYISQKITSVQPSNGDDSWYYASQVCDVATP